MLNTVSVLGAEYSMIFMSAMEANTYRHLFQYWADQQWVPLV
jgi:hypothetical protein